MPPGEILVFYCTFVLLRAIYLPVLKKLVHMYQMWRINRLWLTQIYLYRWFPREINAGVKRKPNKTINIVVVRKKFPITSRFSVFKRAECSSSLNLVRVDK